MTTLDLNAALAPYGASVTQAGRVISPSGKVLPVRLIVKRGRLRAESAIGDQLIFSGPAHVAAVESFVEQFWKWKKPTEVIS